VDHSVQAAPTTPLSKINRAGLILAFLLGLLDATSPAFPTPEAEAGPPFAVVVLGAILGVITIVAAVVAWRTARRGAIRLAAGARIISAVLALPAFFVDVPPWLKASVGVFVVLTVATVVMMLAPQHQPQPVTD